MLLKKWDQLPKKMRNESVRKYYDILQKKKSSLIIKRVFDIITSLFTIIIFLPLLLVLCIAIKIDSEGPVLFRQIRITQYGRKFRIFKFRTMVEHAEKLGPQVTTGNDIRVTKVGKFLRKYRLDETPQLFNIMLGDMTFVGTRPEVLQYVKKYTDEMLATLLLPAGVTSDASIQYKDEEELLANADDADDTYINKVLSEKMKYNLKSLESFCFFGEIKTMIRTVGIIFIKDGHSETSIMAAKSNKEVNKINS